jgi:hypothetical protein
VLPPAVRKALDAERALVYAWVLLGEPALLATFGFITAVFLVSGPTRGRAWSASGSSAGSCRPAPP